MPTDARAYEAEEILRDGGSIHIRAIRPDDKERLVDHFQHLSQRSVYFRFFGAKRRLTDEEIKRFTEPDFVHHVGLVATLLEDGQEHIIGVGRYIARDDGSARTEPTAHRVRPAEGRPSRWPMRTRAAASARSCWSISCPSRAPTASPSSKPTSSARTTRCSSVFAKSGFVVRRSLEGGVVHVSFPTEETPEFLQASLARERAAAAQSIRSFLNPRSVAVVGASRHHDTHRRRAARQPEARRLHRPHLSGQPAWRRDRRTALLPERRCDRRAGGSGGDRRPRGGRGGSRRRLCARRRARRGGDLVRIRRSRPQTGRVDADSAWRSSFASRACAWSGRTAWGC